MSEDYETATLRRFLGAEIFDQIHSAISGSTEDMLFGLSLSERIALHIYTESRNWYLPINQALRSGVVSDDIQIIASLIDRALDRLPVYEGVIFRGVELDLDEARLRYSPDAPWVCWQAFSSTSPDLQMAYAGNVLFVIHSHHGRLLQGYSASEIEREVLLPRNSWYRVYRCDETEARLIVELGEVQW